MTSRATPFSIMLAMDSVGGLAVPTWRSCKQIRAKRMKLRMLMLMHKRTASQASASLLLAHRRWRTPVSFLGGTLSQPQRPPQCANRAYNTLMAHVWGTLLTWTKHIAQNGSALTGKRDSAVHAIQSVSVCMTGIATA